MGGGVHSLPVYRWGPTVYLCTGGGPQSTCVQVGGPQSTSLMPGEGCCYKCHLGMTSGLMWSAAQSLGSHWSITGQSLGSLCQEFIACGCCGQCEEGTR